jgi:hypothetical protein
MRTGTGSADPLEILAGRVEFELATNGQNA